MTSLRQSGLRTRRVLRLATQTASPDHATPSHRRSGNDLVNSPLCLCNSMFVDPERRPLAVARSFKYQSPPGANPELQDGVALRKQAHGSTYCTVLSTPAREVSEVLRSGAWWAACGRSRSKSVSFMGNQLWCERFFIHSSCARPQGMFQPTKALFLNIKA